MMSDDSLARLKRGTVDFHVEAELTKLLNAGKPLLIKAGFDPTRPDLHIGHTVLMQKMRDFQAQGHRVVFVVGDMTARIGDPTGRNATRPALSEQEIVEAAKTYHAQAMKILDPKLTEVRYNSEWLAKLNLDDIIRLASRFTLARMLERDDFKQRWRGEQPIALHELWYPIMQAYDSVVLKPDVELGGTDQLFNLLMGRELMRDMGLKPQIVMTTPILEGLSARIENGKLVGDKMSKSLDNYVGVNEPPGEQFGKLMSISDDLMWRYYELLSRRDVSEAKAQPNPRDAKLDLAQEIVARFHDESAAKQAREAWLNQFSKKEIPDEMKEITLEGEALLVNILGEHLLPSRAEARRRIQAGAVGIDGTKISDITLKLTPRPEPFVIKAGKRDWLRLTLR